MSVQPLAGTGGARQPFFSPDGTSVGFFTTLGEMKKASVAGGPPVVIARNIDSSGWATGLWLPDGTIVFGSLGRGGLQRISSDGGAAASITTPAEGENHFQPAIIPGSEALLFTVRAFDGATRIDAINLDGGQRRTVIENARNPIFLDARTLAFARDDLLLEAPFDASAIALAGSPQPLTDRVRFDQAQGTPQLAVAANGTRVYPPAIDARKRIVIVSRNGMFQELNIAADDTPNVSLSPDGQRLAYAIGRNEEAEVRVYDLGRGSALRFTRKAPEDEAVWSRDGRWIAVSSRDGISIRDISGSEHAAVPRGNAQFVRNMDWSPDGAVLAYTMQTGASQDIWVVGADGRGARRLIAGEPSVFGAKFSPDGKWLAFTSTESGRNQVYVQRYPAGERLAVSIGGGTGPVWRRDGRELFFQGALDGGGKLLAASVTPSGNSLVIATPKPLFDLRVPLGDGSFAQYFSSNNAASRYDVFPDGQRFVMIRGIESPERELVVVSAAGYRSRR
jgi:serine/threonine-protein kinase